MTTIGVFAAVFDAWDRVLCVRQNYGEFAWCMPGGQLEPGEDPLSCLRREILEEAAVRIDVDHLVGVYSSIYKDDLVLFFAAHICERLPWSPTDEISEVGFFPLSELPEPMAENPRLRIRDLIEGAEGVIRTLSAPGIEKVENALVGRSA